MKLLTWGIVGAALFAAMKGYGKSNQGQKDSYQQTTTPVQLVANANPLTANSPKQ
ncbi:hypothetical protein [Lysinibacillus fusiformis]|uniref:hypothetical protein n=1 Tax=Lysinibacillus fusiformis TaxID=28031 RepID=UPI000A5D4F18|nr:hypothetical protein [Lysinibacillus fusiformis]